MKSFLLLLQHFGGLDVIQTTNTHLFCKNGFIAVHLTRSDNADVFSAFCAKAWQLFYFIVICHVTDP